MDVSDLEAGFKGNYYVYRYLNGKLTKLDASFVEEDETLVLETNTLGRFVITDKEIKDGSTVVEGMEPSSSETSSNSSSSENGSNNSGNSGKPNPETGVGASAAIATAVIAISGAALALSKNPDKDNTQSIDLSVKNERAAVPTGTAAHLLTMKENFG